MKTLIQVIIALVFIVHGFAFAQDKKVTEKSSNPIAFSSTAKITVKADRLQMKNENDKRKAVYSGNVLVTQAGLTIQADQLNILSKESKVQFLEATGKPVYVENTEPQKNLKAEANKIIYDIKSGWLDLSGGEAEIIYNKNKVNGSHIRYNLNTQDIEAEGYSNRPALLVIDPNSQ